MAWAAAIGPGMQLGQSLGILGGNVEATKMWEDPRFAGLLQGVQRGVPGSVGGLPSLSGSDVGGYMSTILSNPVLARALGMSPSASTFGGAFGPTSGYEDYLRSQGDIFKTIMRQSGVESGAATAGAGRMTQDYGIGRYLREAFAPQQLQRETMLRNVGLGEQGNIFSLLGALSGQGASFLGTQRGQDLERLGLQNQRDISGYEGLIKAMSVLAPQMYKEQQYNPGMLDKYLKGGADPSNIFNWPTAGVAGATGLNQNNVNWGGSW